MKGQSNYLLFDGVLQEDLLPWLYSQDETLEILPLYTGTRWAQLKDIGPVLVQTGSSGSLLAKFENDTHLMACCSRLMSTQPAQTISRHLQQFITVTDTLGSHSLLRFADPLVIQHWLGSYSKEALGKVLGPIDAWHVAAHQPRWQTVDGPTWLQFSSPSGLEAEFSFKPSHLEEAQTQALEQAYEQRFRDRLDLWLEESYPNFRTARMPTWGNWLESQLHNARQWGLTTERSLAVWIDACIRLGEDTFVDSHSPYSDWLAAHPQARSASPDQRIQAFDAADLPCHQKGLL